MLINFFASWCGPCKRETPLLASFYREHHGRVLIIGVDSDDQSAAALRFTRAAGLSYPVGVDPGGSVATSYGIIALPQTFMLNAQHQIVRHIAGEVTPGELTAWAAAWPAARASRGLAGPALLGVASQRRCSLSPRASNRWLTSVIACDWLPRAAAADRWIARAAAVSVPRSMDQPCRWPGTVRATTGTPVCRATRQAAAAASASPGPPAGSATAADPAHAR